MSIGATPAPAPRRASPDSGTAGRIAPAPTGESAEMRAVLAAAEDVAVGTTTVLILGESGTGKEILARHIHRCSPRAAMPWVAVNCAALPPALLESELFGHERGSFTGASERRIGRIEQADRGTLLLDEVSELPLGLQAKLLRVLQEREIDRIGGKRPIPVDVRVIATSNRSLVEMVARKEFRADLFYRLEVFPIQLPPLRQRREDIPLLADDLLRALSQTLGRQAPVLGPAAREALSRYAFPGNVRELGNILERALVRCREAVLDLPHLDLPEPTVNLQGEGDGGGAGGESLTDVLASAVSPLVDAGTEVARAGDPVFPPGLTTDLPTLERLAIGEALRLESGNRTRAARRLGISLRTLRNKLRDYREAIVAGGQKLPGRDDRCDIAADGGSRARSSTLARTSQEGASSRTK